MLLGPAWHDLLWAFQVAYIGSVAAGFGAILTLRSGGGRADALVAALLATSLLCSSVGLGMVVGVVVWIILERPHRWRRLWTAALPLALYSLWYFHYGLSDASGQNLSRVPEYLVHAFAAAVASISGLG